MTAPLRRNLQRGRRPEIPLSVCTAPAVVAREQTHARHPVDCRRPWKSLCPSTDALRCVGAATMDVPEGHGDETSVALSGSVHNAVNALDTSTAQLASRRSVYEPLGVELAAAAPLSRTPPGVGHPTA